MTTAAATVTAPRDRVLAALLQDVVTRVAADRTCWEPLVAAAPRGVAWARVAVPEDVEVFVVTWPTFTETALHSHDGAASAFVTVRGVVTEVRPDDRGRLLPRKFAPGLVGTLGGEDVHELQNEHADLAVSVHAFTPRLRSVTYWERVADGLAPVRTEPVRR